MANKRLTVFVEDGKAMKDPDYRVWPTRTRQTLKPGEAWVDGTEFPPRIKAVGWEGPRFVVHVR